MIRGFPAAPTVAAGGTLTLHVSTDAPRFRVEVHRWGPRPVPVLSTGWLPGAGAPDHLPYQDWSTDGTGLRGEPLAGWPGHRVELPADWPSGVYLAVLVEDGADAGVGPWSPDGAALLVARPRSAAAPILYKLPLLTWHAYNQVVRDPPPDAGWCLYTVPERAELPVEVPPAVNLRRPGGGTGGTPWDHRNTDPYDPTPRQTFAHWDAPFLAWLERAGHRVDCCTDLDLHADPGLLEPYRLLVSVGHDEYWSDAMRAAAHRFVHRGGNVAFFGGNTCWWRVTFDDAWSFRRVTPWWEAGDPENSLTGVSFRNGGERDRDEHPVRVGYRVQHASHWVFDGTGLRDGDTFGTEQYLVGYECDGAHFDRDDLARGGPVRPSGLDGTPWDFVVLGVGDVAVSGWGLGNRAATMGLHSPGGTVFTAATTDWARVLASGTASAVERITRNVLDRLAT